MRLSGLQPRRSKGHGRLCQKEVSPFLVDQPLELLPEILRGKALGIGSAGASVEAASRLEVFDGGLDRGDALLEEESARPMFMRPIGAHRFERTALAECDDRRTAGLRLHRRDPEVLFRRENKGTGTLH